MFEIKVNRNIVSAQETEPLISGSVSVYRCRFSFDATWDGFFRSAVFRVGSKSITVPLDADDTCDLPWELLVKENIGLTVEVSVYGVNGETEILPTIWDKLGRIRRGSEPGDDAKEFSPGVYDRIVSLVKLYSDKTKGDKGDKGDPGNGDMNTATYDPQGRARDIFSYVDHALDGAVKKSGDTMSGPLGIDKGNGQAYFDFDAGNNLLYLRHASGNNLAQFSMNDNLLRYYTSKDGGANWAIGEILHTGNMPKGVYVGTGDATPWTVDTGALPMPGGVLSIATGAGMHSFVFFDGALLLDTVNGSVVTLGSDKANYRNGVLTIATDNVPINGAQVIFYYQVL